MYSMIQFCCVIMLYFKGSVLGNWQYLYQDLFLVFPLVVFMGNTHARKKLTIKRPSGDLLSVTNVFNVVTHIIICLGFQLCIFIVTPQQDGYVVVDNPDNGSEIYETTALYYFSNFQYITMAFLFALGWPWKRPIYTNYRLSFWLVLSIACSLALLYLYSDSFFLYDEDMDLSRSFRNLIALVVVFNSMANVVFEWILFPLVRVAIKKALIAHTHSVGSVFGPGGGRHPKVYHKLRQQFEANWKCKVR